MSSHAQPAVFAILSLCFQSSRWCYLLNPYAGWGKRPKFAMSWMDQYQLSERAFGVPLLEMRRCQRS
jgi:hypothetical protein